MYALDEIGGYPNTWPWLKKIVFFNDIIILNDEARRKFIIIDQGFALLE
jgi:hypothetical protein